MLNQNPIKNPDGTVWQPSFAEAFVWATVASVVAGVIVYVVTWGSRDER